MYAVILMAVSIRLLAKHAQAADKYACVKHIRIKQCLSMIMPCVYAQILPGCCNASISCYGLPAYALLTFCIQRLGLAFAAFVSAALAHTRPNRAALFDCAQTNHRPQTLTLRLNALCGLRGFLLLVIFWVGGGSYIHIRGFAFC